MVLFGAWWSLDHWFPHGDSSFGFWIVFVFRFLCGVCQVVSMWCLLFFTQCPLTIGFCMVSVVKCFLSVMLGVICEPLISAWCDSSVDYCFSHGVWWFPYDVAHHLSCIGFCMVSVEYCSLHGVDVCLLSSIVFSWVVCAFIGVRMVLCNRFLHSFVCYPNHGLKILAWWCLLFVIFLFPRDSYRLLTVGLCIGMVLSVIYLFPYGNMSCVDFCIVFIVCLWIWFLHCVQCPLSVGCFLHGGVCLLLLIVFLFLFFCCHLTPL